jgi:adenylate cyclase
MPTEIERKFLLANDDWKGSVTRRIRIRDGLIASNNGNKARVRIADSNATITLKSRRRGSIRTEFEYQFRILTPWKYCERCVMVMF